MFSIFKYAFLHGQSKTIHEILTEKNVPLGKKSPFTAQEVSNLSTKPPECLDITLLNKICQTLWDKGYNCPSDQMRNLVRKIKDERNNVSHEECSISENELDYKLSQCGDLLKEILGEAKKLYPAHKVELNKLETEILTVIPEIKDKIREKYNPSNPDDIRRLQDEIREFGDHLREYVLEKSQGELRDLYKLLCRILPFEWLVQYGVIEPCEFMVFLKVDTDKEFHGDFSDNELMNIDQRELLSKKAACGSDPDVVILSGDAGSGKTTILRSIVEKWYKQTNDMPNLSSFEILLYMQFRKRDHSNFDDYLRDLLHGAVLDLNFEVVKSSILRSRCLFLCDGYDEANPESKKLFEEILQLKCSRKKIIVTTRPVNSRELTSYVNTSQYTRINLSILGLRKEDMESHIQSIINYLIHNSAKRDEMVRDITQIFKSMSFEMSGILKNPLWFNLFSLLYIECPNLRGKIKTVSALYIEIQKHLKNRLIKKVGIMENVVDDFERFYRRMSLKYHLEEKYELSEEDAKVFERQCCRLNLSFETIMSSYFSVKHSRKGLNLVRIYCYKHRSEQEFAAAGAICDVIIRMHREERRNFAKLISQGNLIEHAATLHMTDFPHVPVKKRRRSEAYCNKSIENALEGLLVFITGILYNTRRDLLYLVIEEILRLVKKISATPTMYSILQQEEDLLSKHQVQTENDEEVINAMVKLLSRDLFKVNSSETLQCLPSLLPRLKPKMLFLKVRNIPQEHPYIIPAIETAVENDIYLHLHLLYESSGITHLKESLDRSQTGTKISGKLTGTGVTKLPKSTTSINLRIIKWEALQQLSVCLEELPSLHDLELHLDDDGSFSLDDLTALPFPSGQFVLHYSTSLDLEINSIVERIAKLFNTIWPKRESSVRGSMSAKLYSMRSKFTGEAVKQLCELLSVKVVTLGIYNSDCKNEEKELKHFFLTQNNGYIYFVE